MGSGGGCEGVRRGAHGASRRRRRPLLGISVLLACAPLLLGAATRSVVSPVEGGDLVVLAWNDLGMHCISPSYRQVALLPPANNLWAQVIRRGNPPVVVTTGVSLEYAIVNNTTVAGKSDFWQYAGQLFGAALPPGVGLTGNGLSGTMRLVGDHFEATAIPVLPYNDDGTWQPYQLATVTLRTDAGGAPKRTTAVVPVSDEIRCDQCHAQGGDATVNLPADPVSGLTGTTDSDLNVLMVHDYYHGRGGVTSVGEDLVGAQPVLCARCHATNALGAPGAPGVRSLSLAMHAWHNGVDRAADATCYSCHPGDNTRCLRTRIVGMGYQGDVPACQDGACHGGIAAMGNPERIPWVTEPTCEQCHGVNYATGSELYRHAKGHGGVLCAACHNSPHAWWPSKLGIDNLQPAALQHAPLAVGECGVCHTSRVEGRSPHVSYYPRWRR